jgi:transposase
MKRYGELVEKCKRLFVGVDVHRLLWHVTIRTEDVVVFSGSIPGAWESLRKLLDRYHGPEIQVVYEAGYFGYSLHDRLVEYGVECIVTPPSLIPEEHGNRVKTDRRDSRKLAEYLAKGILKRVWVPSAEERCHRQVIRRRRQLIGDRVRTQNRIKAELRFYGIEVEAPTGRWSKAYIENLERLRFDNRWMQESFGRLLEEYHFLSTQIERQTLVLRELSETAEYRERVQILRTVPGIGLIAAMELLLELQDIARFRRADQLAAYVGLTPSQYSSGEKVRMGRITGIGKNALRGTLVEVAWRLIGKDAAMREKYDRIKARAGSKRAIIAIARITVLRTRRMLMDHRPYVVGLAA